MSRIGTQLQLLTPPRSAPRKQRVLFVCIGNSCRSQMAEGFARRYGADIMESSSAGLYPAATVAPLTQKVMRDRGIDLSAHCPKTLYEAPGSPHDLVVNISGLPLPPEIRAAQLTWTVQDPVAGPESLHVQVATQIESLVMQLILELRAKPH